MDEDKVRQAAQDDVAREIWQGLDKPPCGPWCPAFSHDPRWGDDWCLAGIAQGMATFAPTGRPCLWKRGLRLGDGYSVARYEELCRGLAGLDNADSST